MKRYREIKIKPQWFYIAFTYVCVYVYVHIHGFYVCTYVYIRRFYVCVPNLGLLHCRQTPYCLSHQGSPIYMIYIYMIYIYICMRMCVCVYVCMYMYVWLQRVLAATYRIFCCGVWASPLVLYGLQSVDSRASCLVARPGIEPRSSTLQGRFLTIRPPDLYSLFMKGKAKVVFNWKKRFQGNTSLF